MSRRRECGTRLRASVAGLAIAGCHPSESARSGASFVADAAPPHGPVETAPVASDDHLPDASVNEAGPGAPGDALARVPVLDPDRGTRAAKDYRAFRGHFCESLEEPGANAPRLLEGVGLPNSPDPTRVCSEGDVAAIASGSFFDHDADEVLLQVWSGAAAAWGERTLALMRADGAHYKLVRHLLAGARFEARLRARVARDLDVLMLCIHRGNMGLYPSECGFLGQGNFREDATDADAELGAKNEIALVAVSVCGPQDWVELGDVSLTDGQISVGLVVVKAVLAPKGAGEGPYCSKERDRHEKRFTVRFAVGSDGRGRHGTGRVRRLTPVPPEVTKVLDLY